MAINPHLLTYRKHLHLRLRYTKNAAYNTLKIYTTLFTITTW